MTSVRIASAFPAFADNRAEFAIQRKLQGIANGRLPVIQRKPPLVDYDSFTDDGSERFIDWYDEGVRLVEERGKYDNDPIRIGYTVVGVEGEVLYDFEQHLYLYRGQKYDSVKDIQRGAPPLHLFESESTYNAIPPDFLAHSKKLLIQCAVAGGEIYRMILKGHQPQVRHLQRAGKDYRASSAVERYQEWPFEYFEDDEVNAPPMGMADEFAELKSNRRAAVFAGMEPSKAAIDKEFPLIAGTNLVYTRGKAKPIRGVLSVFATALFLGDLDLNAGNLGLVETEDSFSAVKIDPEVSFSRMFFEQGPAEVEAALREPAKDWDNEDFAATFAGTIREGLDEQEDLIAGLIGSQEARLEMYATIATILKCPLAQYRQVIDRCLSDEFQQAKILLMQSFERRLEVFRQVAARLENFSRLYPDIK